MSMQDLKLDLLKWLYDNELHSCKKQIIENDVSFNLLEKCNDQDIEQLMKEMDLKTAMGIKFRQAVTNTFKIKNTKQQPLEPSAMQKPLQKVLDNESDHKVMDNDINTNLDVATVKKPFVILIGIENYDTIKSKYNGHRLDGVKHDIYRMANLWHDTYGYKNISIVFVANKNSNDKKGTNTLKNLEKYQKYFNFPQKNMTCDDSYKIISNSQSFTDYLVKIRGMIDISEENDSLIFYSGHGIKDKIILLDGKSYSISKISDIFNGEQCVQLRDKPKIMIYNCCRGNHVAQGYDINNNNNCDKMQKTRGNVYGGNNNWYHPNSGLATIFSNFSGFSINDSADYGGCLTRAIDQTFRDPSKIDKISLRDLIVGIRRS